MRDQSDEKSGYQHIFGPVPSRRLGRSLGVDLVPHKVCSLDCVYCECGATTRKTLLRREWVPTDEVLAELSRWLEQGGTADYLTFSGAGEPTLHRDLGRIARWVVTRTATPLALITNGTLFGDPAVRAEVQPCAVILPSLDAADEETFARINRPYPGLTAADLVDGLVALREEFAGEIRLEVLLVEGINDTDASLDTLAAAIARIRPDIVQVNTAVRPGTEADVGAASRETLDRALGRFGAVAPVEAIASFAARCAETSAATPSVQRFGPVFPASPAPAGSPGTPGPEDTLDEAAEAVLAVVRRRPETIVDLAAGLHLPASACRDAVAALVRADLVYLEEKGGEQYVIATSR